MPISTQPFVLNNVSVTLKKIKNSDGSAATGTRTEYRCQLNTATLTPSAAAGAAQTYDTFCDTFSSGGGGGATWVLGLAGFQAYADVTDLSLILFDDEGAVYEYVLTPMGGVVSATNPAFQGQVTIIPTVIGGVANQYATFTVDLPAVSKPTKIVAPPTLLTAGEEPEGEESEVFESDAESEVAA
jgi:hypothetical protein